MVYWVRYAIYRPCVRRLMWSRGPIGAPLWTMWNTGDLRTDPHVSSERGRLIHALPWGDAPSPMDTAWKVLSNHPTMAPFRALTDHGLGLVRALNYVLIRTEHMPTHGTVDGSVDLGGVWTGVELKTGAWKYAPFWDKQIARHLKYYPQVLLVIVTPDAALGNTPALVLCKT